MHCYPVLSTLPALSPLPAPSPLPALSLLPALSPLLPYLIRVQQAVVDSQLDELSQQPQHLLLQL